MARGWKEAVVALGLLGAGMSGIPAIQQVRPAPPDPTETRPLAPAARAAVAKAYGRLPQSFEPNVGQASSGVDFVSRGPGYTATFAATEAVLALRRPDRSSQTTSPQGERLASPAIVAMRLVGGDEAAQASGLERQPGVSNYIDRKSVV